MSSYINYSRTSLTLSIVAKPGEREKGRGTECSEYGNLSVSANRSIKSSSSQSTPFQAEGR